MPSQRSRTGIQGEDLAALYLQRNGYELVARNYRTRYGEIDLVASYKGTMVFVEVRTRRTTAFGTAQESVTARKRQRLVAVAQQYLQEHGLEAVPWRLDLIAISRSPESTNIDHLQALSGEGL